MLYMYISIKQIQKALETIKQVCRFNSCDECPFGIYMEGETSEDDWYECAITQPVQPCQWSLNDDEYVPWRAFAINKDVQG